jgi:hypothetical protein
MPSALAVLRLIRNVNRVDRAIGRSAGFAPRAILSASSAARRAAAAKSPPYVCLTMQI